MRRLGQAFAVVVALFATVATSPRRWSLEAPDTNAQTDSLDAQRPSGHVAFRVTGPDELAKRGDNAQWSFGLRGTARWDGASDPNASTVLHLEYEGLVLHNVKETTNVADVVLRPGQTVDLGATSDWDTKCSKGRCRFSMHARYRWEQPDGRVEITWEPFARVNGYLERRESEPSPKTPITITVIE